MLRLTGWWWKTFLKKFIRMQTYNSNNSAHTVYQFIYEFFSVNIYYAPNKSLQQQFGIKLTPCGFNNINIMWQATILFRCGYNRIRL